MLERLASWVGGLINNAAIRFGPRLGAKPISFHDFGSGKPPWVQFEIENHGKTAAYELVVGGVCLIEPHTISGTLSFPEERIIKDPAIKLAAGSVVQVKVRKPHLPSEDEFHILKDVPGAYVRSSYYRIATSLIRTGKNAPVSKFKWIWPTVKWAKVCLQRHSRRCP